MSKPVFDFAAARPSWSLPAVAQDLSNPFVLVTLLLAVLIPFLVAIWLSTSASLRRKPKSILLLGPSGSGKTALFSRLLFGSARPSHTSIAENRAIVPYLWTHAAASEDLPQGAQKAPEPFALVDTPGHPRLRTRALAKNLNASTAAILTIDATTGLTAKNIRTAADSLQLLLGLRSFQSRLDHFPLLVLLTKTEPNAVLIERAKLTLGREMERRRQAGSSGIGNRVEGLAADQGISRDTKELPTDETEILQAEIWSESPWSWNQEVDLGGVKVDWGMSDGTLGEVYDWMAAHQ